MHYPAYGSTAIPSGLSTSSCTIILYRSSLIRDWSPETAMIHPKPGSTQYSVRECQSYATCTVALETPACMNSKVILSSLRSGLYWFPMAMDLKIISVKNYTSIVVFIFLSVCNLRNQPSPSFKTFIKRRY